MGFPGCEGICLKARLSFLPRGVQGRPGPGQREVQSPARLCLSPHHLARDLCQPEGGASECPLLSFSPGCPPQPRWPPVFAPELCVWKSRCILRKGRKLLPGPQGPCAGPLLWGCLGQSGLRMPSSGGGHAQWPRASLTTAPACSLLFQGPAASSGGKVSSCHPVACLTSQGSCFSPSRPCEASSPGVAFLEDDQPLVDVITEWESVLWTQTWCQPSAPHAL